MKNSILLASTMFLLASAASFGASNDVNTVTLKLVNRNGQPEPNYKIMSFRDQQGKEFKRTFQRFEGRRYSVWSIRHSG